MPTEKISVIVTTKNEEARIGDCLKGIFLNAPDEVIVVDGASIDKTIDIAREYGAKIVSSAASNLTLDRQIGIDAAKNDHIAIIDADHRLKEGDLQRLLDDMKKYNYDIVQSQVVAHNPSGFWDAAESDGWQVTQNIPGPRNMVGTAPAIFKRRVFERARFDDRITSTIDDTDFCYRLSKFPEIRMGIGETVIGQYHFADFGIYVKKFNWYGKGDGEFCRKNPERALSMCYHLVIEYPIVYSWRALKKGYIRAIPFFVLCGLCRFYGLSKYFLTKRSKSNI